MPSSKEIKKQIGSIENTKKITSAMEMVAASKMRKAEARMHATRPYADKIRQVIGHIGKAHPEYTHPFMEEREAKNAGIIIITSDRGLCGGLNTNALRHALNLMEDLQNQGIAYRVAAIGKKSLPLLNRLGVDIMAERSDLGDAPEVTDITGTAKVVMDAYMEGELDRVYLVYNQFVNTMTQNVQTEQILPVTEVAEPDELHWDYIYEPEPQEVIDGLMARYVESLVYHGVVENIASEQAARMVAMKSASDNAEDLIEDLKLSYNKARQAAITAELAEITSGAAALEG
ncbi:F0F1 ATP synthase subunit gamma [Thiohalorhabdus methylotrophus]|uniref:ATP synthase gamma chain n=1 Tax=Thiohalorhabdus methylotrophus TaxID=3242694 RepID=A0ABV4TQD7_9GAMM